MLEEFENLGHDELKYISERLDPSECSQLIGYLIKRSDSHASRKIGKIHFPKNWQEKSSIHCLESLANWNDGHYTRGSSTRDKFMNALYKIGRTDLIARPKKRSQDEIKIAEAKLKTDNFQQ